MEQMTAVDARDEVAVAKQRFESFRLGGGSRPSQNHSHGRSHSRNNSISSSISSLSFSLSSSSSSISVKSANLNDSPSFSSSSGHGSSKRPNSHHRRRSSVSTRRESAELMGVAVPDLPLSTSEDNINLGDKDSIRRRALWALEGKPDVSFSKVEIPELSTPEIEKRMFEFPTKPSFPPGSNGTFSGGLSSLMGKRDSFKLLGPSSSSKDQLQTLMEEEEEEEESDKRISSPISLPGPVLTVAVIKPSPARPRPTSLNLRPLSLTPDSLVTSHGLPTPLLTPSPRSGLKSLALTQASSPQLCTSEDSSARAHTNALKRQSIILPSTTAPLNAIATWRPSNQSCDSPSPAPFEEVKPVRRSSISYKSSAASLPTPEMTPTYADRRYSNSSSDDDLPRSRPLSASEQHFLFKSHNALLARITDLERALSSRPRSPRPLSYASDTSSNHGSLSEPTDEMLQLIADLKAERDELKRDVDGWRTRVSDLEKQVGVFAKRVEAERRDAWVARSRVGLLEVEKGTLEKSLDVKNSQLDAARNECNRLQDHCRVIENEKRRLESEIERSRAAENEASALRGVLQEERLKRTELEKELERANALTTPTPQSFEARMSTAMAARKRGLGFTSVDSESSTTDVESCDEGHAPFGFQLKVVEEEEEYLSEEDNGLARYEDEEDSDLSFQSPSMSTSSSLGEDDFPRKMNFQLGVLPMSVTPPLSRSGSGSPTVRSRSSSPPPTPVQDTKSTHTSRASLSKTWTFPKGSEVSSLRGREDEVDRFFGCLEDVDGSPPLGSVPSTYEGSKGLFARGLMLQSKYTIGDNDELPPFVLPNDVGVEAIEPMNNSGRLDVVVEEDEEVFGEVGGITITLTPADADDSMESLRPEASTSQEQVAGKKPFIFFEEEEEEHDVPFCFGRSDNATKSSDIHPPALPTPPSSIPSHAKSVIPRAASPSSIPRSVALKSLSNPVEIMSSTPPKTTPVSSFSATSYPANAYITPPTKRGGMIPSFIPQPVSSPSPIRIASSTKQSTISSTFIRQPQRKPVPMIPSYILKNTTGAINNGSTSQPHTTSACANFMLSVNDPPMNTLRRSSHSTPTAPAHSGTDVTSVDLTHPSLRSVAPVHEHSVSSFSSIMSSPLSARLSFQTLTSLIPLSWTPRIPRETVVSAAAALCLSPENESPSGANSGDDETPQSSDLRPVQASVHPRKPTFVSKEKQLDKLRSRMMQENTEVGSLDICRKCDDKTVVL